MLLATAKSPYKCNCWTWSGSMNKGQSTWTEMDRDRPPATANTIMCLAQKLQSQQRLAQFLSGWCFSVSPQNPLSPLVHVNPTFPRINYVLNNILKSLKLDSFLCYRWWETSGGGGFQQCSGLSIRWGQETASGKCFYMLSHSAFSELVKGLFIYLNMVFEPDLNTL